MNAQIRKSIILKSVILLLFFCTSFQVQSCFANSPIKTMENKTDSDYQKAIQLADDLFPELKLKRSDYKLIGIQNMVIKGQQYEGPHIWRITYKLSSLIPKDEMGMIGAGGEVFIKVDIKNNKATVTGYGE